MSIDRALQVAGIVVGLIGGGLLYLYPNTKPLGWGMLALGVLVAACATFWALGGRYALREHKARLTHPSSVPARRTQKLNAPIRNTNKFEPSNTFAPTINVNPAQAQTVRYPPPIRERPPVFEATANARIVHYILNLNDSSLIREPYYGESEDLPEDKQLVNVALAQFLYRPDEGVEPYLYVTAHIFPHDTNGLALRPALYSTVWDNDELSGSQEFYAGTAHDLILALIPPDDPKAIILYEHSTQTVLSYYGSDRVFAGKPHIIEGEAFLIQVEMIPKKVNDPLPKQCFWFRLNLKPTLEIVTIQSPATQHHEST